MQISLKTRTPIFVFLGLILAEIEVHAGPQQSKGFQYALHSAAAAGDLHALAITYGLHIQDINEQDDQGVTPLGVASHRAIAEYLVRRGAKINPHNGSKSPLSLALLGNRTEVALYLLSQKADPIEIVDGKSLVRIATENGNLEIVNALINSGAKIAEFDPEGNTLLHSAAIHNHESLIDLFVQDGISVASRNSEGNTPLHLAVTQGNKTIVDYMLINGPRKVANKANKVGNTPLHLSALHGYSDIYDLLISHGADETVVNSEGDTPKDLLLKNTPKTEQKGDIEVELLASLPSPETDVIKSTSDSTSELYEHPTMIPVTHVENITNPSRPNWDEMQKMLERARKLSTFASVLKETCEKLK